MFVKRKIFGFYVILSLSFMTNKISGETDLSILIKDNNNVAQDVCYSIIKENPCAQNVLKTLIAKIDDNSNQIKELKHQIDYNWYQTKDLKDLSNYRDNQIKELKDQINTFTDKFQKKEEQVRLLQNKLERKQQQVDTLEDQLQNIFVGNNKLRVNAQNSKSNVHFKTINDSLKPFINESNTSYGTLNNDASREIESWSLVRQLS